MLRRQFTRVIMNIGYISQLIPRRRVGAVSRDVVGRFRGEIEVAGLSETACPTGGACRGGKTRRPARCGDRAHPFANIIAQAPPLVGSDTRQWRADGVPPGRFGDGPARCAGLNPGSCSTDHSLSCANVAAVAEIMSWRAKMKYSRRQYPSNPVSSKRSSLRKALVDPRGNRCIKEAFAERPCDPAIGQFRHQALGFEIQPAKIAAMTKAR